MLKSNLTGRLQFIREAEKLKDTLRSSYTSKGRQESTAEHSWRLSLLAMIFEDQLPTRVDFSKILKLCMIHDLGEAIHGDIPAIKQIDLRKKKTQEYNDLLQLMASLDDDSKKKFLQLWEEYEESSSLEAQVVKAFDKIETLLQHNQGANPEDFDYYFNLTYGKEITNILPLFSNLRKEIDEETIKNIKKKKIIKDDNQLKKNALIYHEFPVPGKIQVTATKPLFTERELSLAYSPGVAAPCLEIFADPRAVNKYTSRGNLIGIVSNGTAVLGLGNIGPLAVKPVLEGKAVLFKKLAGINAFDLELKALDPELLTNIIASLEPSFGAIVLEDIKAPECFYIEKTLRKSLKIPVFHDDQHGTAIILSAAVINGLRLVNKKLSEIKLVVSGAGASAIACLDLLVTLGITKNNIVVCDSKGVIYKGREKNMSPTKVEYAINPSKGKSTLDEVILDADIFLGCSKANVLTQAMVKKMAKNPLIFALANPQPEILPPLAKAVRSDIIICTGRSDYPNQVNNVLCFPFILRGALDVEATTINQEMKLAAVYAIANLALSKEQNKIVTTNNDETFIFGSEYLIPKPFDPRLILKIAPAVAKAAITSGVATTPITDFAAYETKLSNLIRYY